MKRSCLEKISFFESVKAKMRASSDKRDNMLRSGWCRLMIVSVCEGRLRVLMGQSGQFDWRLWDSVLHLTYPTFAQFPLCKMLHLGSHSISSSNQSLCHTISIYLSVYLSIYLSVCLSVKTTLKIAYCTYDNVFGLGRLELLLCKYGLATIDTQTRCCEHVRIL